MKSSVHRFRLLPGDFAVCRLKPGSAVPGWVTGSFVSITMSTEELSIVCSAAQVPVDVQGEHGWRLLKVDGPFPFATTGVLASFARPLAEAEISVLAIATFDTDYLLIKGDKLTAAVAVLVAAGHTNVN